MAKSRGMKGGFLIGVANFLTFLVYAVTFYAGIYFLKRGDVGLTDMYLSILALVLSAFGSGTATQFMPDVGAARTAATNIFNLLDAPLFIEGEQTEKMKLEKFEGRIDFINVSFRYPTRPNYILKKLSFSISPG